VGLDVFKVFRTAMRELGWVMQAFCDWRGLARNSASWKGLTSG